MKLTQERMEEIRNILSQNLPMLPELRKVLNLDLLAHIDALEAENKHLSEAHEAAQHYKQECNLLKEHVGKLKKEMKSASRILDGIKYECEASVYTLEDDEYSSIFYARDILDKALAADDDMEKK